MEDYLGLTIATNERHQHTASPKQGKEICETRSTLTSYVENPDMKPEQWTPKKKPTYSPNIVNGLPLPDVLGRAILQDVSDSATERSASLKPPSAHLKNLEKIPSAPFAPESLTDPKPWNMLQFSQQLHQSLLTNILPRNTTKSDSSERFLLRRNPPKKPSLPSKSTKKRTTYLWSETWGKETAFSLTKQELTRQETLYELWQGECNLIEDLSMLQRIYRDSLLHLGYITEIEANQIFGGIQMLISIHTELREQLLKAVRTDSCFNNVGMLLINWIPKLETYESYCFQQVGAKRLIDEKIATNPFFENFLKLCLDSCFSRRLDLWNYLDAPRARIFKYPLLISQVLKFTPNDHDDRDILEHILQKLSEILAKIDRSIGLASCKHAIEQIDLSDGLCPVFAKASTVICNGALETSHGLKLHGFLFDSGLVLTSALPNKRLSLYSSPYEAGQFKIVDLGSDVGHTSFLQSCRGKVRTRHLFRVETSSWSATLATFDESNKKMWMAGLHKVVNGNSL